MKHGYDLDAVPYDYLETPPADILRVKKNLDIIQQQLLHLKDTTTDHPIHFLLRSLKNVIIPKMVREF